VAIADNRADPSGLTVRAAYVPPSHKTGVGDLLGGGLAEGQIPVRAALDRTVAVQTVPYPPGIPLMMPGEKAGADKRALIDYLLAMELFDSHFPGFGHDNHGVEVEHDAQGQLTYRVYVVTQ